MWGTRREDKGEREGMSVSRTNIDLQWLYSRLVSEMDEVEVRGEKERGERSDKSSVRRSWRRHLSRFSRLSRANLPTKVIYATCIRRSTYVSSHQSARHLRSLRSRKKLTTVFVSAVVQLVNKRFTLLNRH